ncbi:MAG: hypothetical protein ACREYE_31345 [Gammaproteobacteria bacterium]
MKEPLINSEVPAAQYGPSFNHEVFERWRNAETLLSTLKNPKDGEIARKQFSEVKGSLFVRTWQARPADGRFA